LNHKEGQEQASDDGSDGFEKIDLSDRRSLVLAILGIEFTSISEKGSIGKGYREKDCKRRVPYGGEPESFSWGREENIFKYPAEKDGKREG